MPDLLITIMYFVKEKIAFYLFAAFL